MSIGAVIVAAGMSSRMGDFKPMLSIGSQSIARRIVSTLRQAGAEEIVMITGHNADALERHLEGCGLTFIRNERYATTQMFDSAALGLDYLKDKCGRILFTPVDVPLFEASTARALIDSGAELACPVCDGKRGHPILIAARLVDGILAYSGDGGLGKAMAACGETMIEIPVNRPQALFATPTHRRIIRPCSGCTKSGEEKWIRTIDMTGRSVCHISTTRGRKSSAAHTLL